MHTLRAALSALVVTICGLSALAGPATAQYPAAAQDLCSKDGLMRLVPQLRNAEGRFQVPDPTKDLGSFLAAQQGLSNAIEMILAQAYLAGDPYAVATAQNEPLTLGAHWRAAEIGLQTDGSSIGFADADFAAYGGLSFLDGLRPIKRSNGVFYAIAANGRFPALVYPMPTILPCVNRLYLAADNTAGSWPPPTYALGSAAGDDAFLIVNICQDLGIGTILSSGERILEPKAMMILAFQWADTDDMADFRTDTKAHRH